MLPVELLAVSVLRGRQYRLPAANVNCFRQAMTQHGHARQNGITSAMFICRSNRIDRAQVNFRAFPISALAHFIAPSQRTNGWAMPVHPAAS
jgi:hypothetical protein